MCKHTLSSSDLTWELLYRTTSQHTISIAQPVNSWLVRLAALSCERFPLQDLKRHRQTVFEVPEAVVETFCFKDVTCRCLYACDRGFVLAAEDTTGKLWETVFLLLIDEIVCSQS